MRWITVLIFCLLGSTVFAAESSSPHTINAIRPIVSLTTLGLIIVLIIYGLRLSIKKKIVIFANYTDILFTALAPVSAMVVPLIFAPVTKQNIYFIEIPALVFLLLVCWSTFLYNQSIDAGISGFLIALPIKVLLISVYLILLLANSLVSTRRKGQSRTSYKKQSHAFNGSLSSLLAYLGLWDKKFVSIGAYLTGNWNSSK